MRNELTKNEASCCSRPSRGENFVYGRHCHRCLAIRNRTSWALRSSFEFQGSSYSWLRIKSAGDSGPWGVGCWLCNFKGGPGHWATFSVTKPISRSLELHARTSRHLAALDAYLHSVCPPQSMKVEGSVSASRSAYVPSAFDFQRAFCKALFCKCIFFRMRGICS